MDDGRFRPGPRGNPAAREAVRSQIVVHGLVTSVDIAAAIGLPITTVTRILRRFEAVEVLTLQVSPKRPDDVRVEPDSLTDRFRDLAKPLW